MSLFRPTPIEKLQGCYKFKDKLRLAPRRLTASWRVLPDFLIIGAHKCGTTALYDYLVEHPQVLAASDKEIHFFDLNYTKGVDWYRARFPTRGTKARAERIQGRPILTGEASPSYIVYPHAPRRAKELLPQVKLIAMLRNPVDRAFSHHHHEIRKKRESLSFEEVIRREPERLAGEWDRMLRDDTYISCPYNYYSHLSRGVYVDQIQNWHRYFPREQMLVIRSEDFFGDTPRVYREVQEFLGLEPVDLKAYEPSNVGVYRSKMDPALRKQLAEYYRSHNRRLEEYLGRSLGWDD